jgi:hypothetical protein
MRLIGISNAPIITRLAMLFPVSRLHTEPLLHDEAAAYVTAHHRHLPEAPTGHIFSVGCYADGFLVGVAMCGRPVSRHLDNGHTLEVYRVCTQGHKNACSKLYGTCQQIARKKGYKSLITYTLLSESASSVRGANFTLAATNVGAKCWGGKRQATRKSGHTKQERKNRWAYDLQPCNRFDCIIYPHRSFVRRAGLPLPAYPAAPKQPSSGPRPTPQQFQDLHELANLAHRAGFVLTIARHNPRFPLLLTTVRVGSPQDEGMQWCDTHIPAAERLRVYFTGALSQPKPWLNNA